MTNNTNKNKPIIKPPHMPEDLRKGVYSNIARILVSKEDVIIDFSFRDSEEINVVSRVILSIEHAKLLEKTLSKLLKIKNNK